MKRTISILGAVVLFSVGCSIKPTIHYKKPMYVSPTKYEKLSCKELDYELYNYGTYSCKELKEKLLFISPTEYAKLSCKQLHEQLLKINERLDAKLRIEREDAAATAIAIPFILLTTAGVPFIMESGSKSESSLKSDTKEISEIEILKATYKTLQKVATKKNCSFAVDMNK